MYVNLLPQVFAYIHTVWIYFNNVENISFQASYCKESVTLIAVGNIAICYHRWIKSPTVIFQEDPVIVSGLTRDKTI